MDVILRDTVNEEVKEKIVATKVGEVAIAGFSQEGEKMAAFTFSSASPVSLPFLMQLLQFKHSIAPMLAQMAKEESSKIVRPDFAGIRTKG